MQLSAKKDRYLALIALILSLFISRQGLAQEVNNSEAGIQEAKLFQVPVTPPPAPPPSTNINPQQADNPPSPVIPPSSTSHRTNLPTYDLTAGEKLAYG